MNQSRTVRLPIHLIKELNLVLRALRKLDCGRGAEEASHNDLLKDVAKLLGRPLGEIHHLLMLNERSTSLDAPLDMDSSLSLVDALADEVAEDPAAYLGQREVEVLISDWVGELDQRHRLVIERRYGLGGRDVATLETLANELELTRERVRQIQMEALVRLRKRIAREGLAADALLI